MAKKSQRRADTSSHDHSDVVIDTNVLAHSANSTSHYHADALEFLIAVVDQGERYWVLDDNGKAAPLLETSLLWSEYQQTLAPTSVAMILFQQMLAGGRVCFATRPGEEVRNRIRRLVPGNAKDRVVLGAAVQSGSKWLVTNDEADFSDSVRDVCECDWAVTISAVVEAGLEAS